MLKEKIFISYAHDDIDRNTLDLFKQLLEEHSNSEFEVLIDQDLPFGANLDEFMQMIDSHVNAVLILLTPAYKQKVIERKGGVFEEYRRLIYRYQQIHFEEKQGKKAGEIEGYFSIIPILYSGTHETSVPPELLSLKYLDMVTFRASRTNDEQLVISNEIARQFIPLIIKLCDSIRFLGTIKSRSFTQLYTNFFERLFLDLKADWQKPNDYLHRAFVKTISYRKVESQAVYFIVGRKGSGKTTIADVISIANRERYIGNISVIADKFHLEILYALFSLEKIQSDMRTAFPQFQCFQFVWEVFFHICCMEALIQSADNGLLTEYQKHNLQPIKEFIHKIKGTETDLREPELTYFVYGANALINFFDECVSKARVEPSFFFSDITALFRRDAFLKYAIGKECLDLFYGTILTLRKKFLITLDGFDTAFDMFRREGIIAHSEIAKRADFETNWLRALLHVVLQLKEPQNKYDSLRGRVDLCITVPQDRFFDVQRSERDSYRYHNRYIYLNWSGVELAILLIHRLEELTQSSTDRRKDVNERINQIFRSFFPNVPTSVDFIHNQRHYEMPVFLYILRHTFWRPRDILIHYSNIFSIAESLRRQYQKMTAETLRRAVKESNYAIIKSEFINEFETTIINIKQILHAFTKQPQVLTFETLKGILYSVDFSFAIGSREHVTIEEKLSYLYRIGFLGFHFNRETQDRLNLGLPHAFYFNEGEAILDIIRDTGFGDYQYVIHPIFSEYLDLDTSTNELILPLSWKYIYESEIF